ncbi:hypothetical protein HDG32_000694 [Paraburkholderia sp. CI2]|nr:hypothetical protein [Paraburkholderia sp. CI2]
MLTNGMFGTLLTPESTVTRTALAASTCGDGDVLVTVEPDELVELLEPFELLEVLESAVVLALPPPPPHALNSSARTTMGAAPSRVIHEDLDRMIRSVIE